MRSMYLLFVHSYVASKKETKKKKMEEKVKMRLKNNFLNHWLMVRLNLSSDDAINFKETAFVKERNLQFGV